MFRHSGFRSSCFCAAIGLSLVGMTGDIPYDSTAGGEGSATKVCTTHLGDVIDGTDLIVMGWYSAGTVMVDFSDLAHPKTVAIWHVDGESSVWETRYYQGYIFSADEVRGLDILSIVTKADAHQS